MSPAEIIAIVWLVLGLPFATFACARWWHWHDEYVRLHRRHIEAMKWADRPFIMPLPPREQPPIFLDGNVIPVDFGARR